jgi:hypothetical protein
MLYVSYLCNCYICLWDNFGKFRATRGVIHDVTKWRIRVACWISKATRTDAHAHVYAPGYPHARMHAHAWTHRPICNTYCFSTAKIISRTRFNVHVMCLFMWFSRQSSCVKYVIFNVTDTLMNVCTHRLQVTWIPISSKLQRTHLQCAEKLTL